MAYLFGYWRPRVRILRTERVEFTRKRQAWEYSPPVKIPPSIIFHRTQTRSAVLRRLENIVCYSAVRMRRMTQYTASGMRLRQLLCLQLFSARARRHKQLSTVYASLTCHFDQKQPKASYFYLFSAVFLYIFHEIGCFQLTTCLP